MTMSGLSAQILGYFQRHPAGVKFADVCTEIRRPVQEIEGALSQLKRQGYAKQSQLGIWVAVNVQNDEAPHVRPDREPELARIPADLAHMQQRPPPSRAPSLLESPATTIRRSPLQAPPQSIQCPPREEPTMGKRTCTKCNQEKAGQAFLSGEEVCRQCKKGKPAAPEKKSAAPTPRRRPRKQAKQLRAIRRKHFGRRPAAVETEDPLLQQLIAKRDRLNVAIAALQGAG